MQCYTNYAGAHMKKKTIGQEVHDILEKEAKNGPEVIDVEDLEREAHKDYEKEVFVAIERGKAAFHGDFYVEVQSRKERSLAERVVRNQFFIKQECPTPQYDQTLYKYHRKDERIEFLWVLPDKNTYNLFKLNALTIHPDQKELLGYILADSAGELEQRAKKLNGYKEDRVVLSVGEA